MSIKRLVGILFLAMILALIIRMSFFETIRVTTPAMSESQAVGNRLIIEKWSVGPRLPISIGIPFVPDTLFDKLTYISISKVAHRLPGFGEVKRNDLIAYNYPTKDETPTDMHPILLSRCVGLPGEYIRLEGARILINDIEIQRPLDVSICYRYPVKMEETIKKQLEANKIDQNTYQEQDSGFVYLTRYQYYALTRRQRGLAIYLNHCSSSYDTKYAVIPYKGFRIELNERSFRTWGELINKYEGIKLTRTTNGHFKKNGKETEFFIFRQNYYWLLNDHQGYLDDSRSFGLIPESHVIGKAWLVLFSPKTGRFLQKI